ncbi:cyclodeaminase/cyclohydrolase family protein [Cloacibacillus sp. An23]|uniref:cyclodeaminase/cyclohydrolase family protein n=1 Tax=Cloacibacillus sp. An23 TaxID=1965591 RepID=UPI000B37CFC6|nr:cyclodeaminase/cyclohydrolase family protein [Cloacibacillus sp. An23]OUO94351.1 sugar ABC transporter substrate-binding protein [Cloacibacillus sp. An23]
MKLAEMQVAEFVNVMASDAPAPGGGSAAALEGALGAALTAMVCALTVGKKKYADVQELAVESQKKADGLKARFVDVIDRDTEAFNAVSAVFAMPKDTDEQKAARKAAMQEALKGCTKTPFEMMQLSCEALELTRSLVGRLNASAASDLGCAALSLKAAVQGAWLNVLINISGINDEAFVSEYRSGGQALLDKALPLADEIYAEILKAM